MLNHQTQVSERIIVMYLYLVQHGAAVAKDVDPERPLSRQGVADIDRLAALLKRADVQFERVIHSGKLRAQQTAERLANVIAPEVALEISDLINPNDNPKAFDWQSGSMDRDTLVVGHLPFLEKLVAHLLIENETRPLTVFLPGTIICLERNHHHWQIKWMIRPELLG